MKPVSTIRIWQLIAFLIFSLLPGLSQSPNINSGERVDPVLNLNPPMPAALSFANMNDGKVAEPEKLAAATADMSGLPNAPSFVREVDRSGSPAILSDQGFTEPVLAPPAKDERVATLPYWATTGVVFGSNIAAIEVLQSCLSANQCQSIPGAMRSRGAMYGVGIPVAAGVSLLDYYLKKKEKRWWYVPAIAATAFNVAFIARGAAR